MGILIKSKLIHKQVKEVMNEHGITHNTTLIIKHNRKKELIPFVKAFQSALLYSVNTLSPAGCKMFLYFMANSQYGNYMEVDQSQIMEVLKISKPSVIKALKELAEINVISVIPDLNDKRRNTYMINPHVMWKGNPTDRSQAITKTKEKFLNPGQIALNLPPKKDNEE